MVVKMYIMAKQTRPVNIRINEHEAATRLNHPDDSATAEHPIECNHSIDYNGTKLIKPVKKAQHLELAKYIEML